MRVVWRTGHTHPYPFQLVFGPMAWKPDGVPLSLPNPHDNERQPLRLVRICEVEASGLVSTRYRSLLESRRREHPLPKIASLQLGSAYFSKTGNWRRLDHECTIACSLHKCLSIVKQSLHFQIVCFCFIVLLNRDNSQEILLFRSTSKSILLPKFNSALSNFHSLSSRALGSKDAIFHVLACSLLQVYFLVIAIH